LPDFLLFRFPKTLKPISLSLSLSLSVTSGGNGNASAHEPKQADLIFFNSHPISPKDIPF